MAEFERWGELSADASRARQFPADFTPEDAATAHWLNTLYDIDGEHLPPRYAQTLLGDPQHIPASDDLEERMLDAVFARLALARPAITRPTPRPRFFDRAALLAQRMGRQMTFGVMALFMLLSYNALGTSAVFASVLQLIAGHTGTQAVTAYPTMVDARRQTLSAADATLNFTPRWPSYLSHQYLFQRMEVLSGAWWTNGAMVALHYERSDGTGSRPLTILEFLPQNGMALQVVQDGSAQQVQIGHDTGVFVWGQWVRHDRQHVTWEASQRAELIFGGNAGQPVIWIAANGLGDLSASQMQASLVGMASSLGPMNMGQTPPPVNSLGALSAHLAQGINQPFNNDIIALVPDRSDPSAPTLYVQVGQGDPNNN
jgi:hypothetical protein